MVAAASADADDVVVVSGGCCDVEDVAQTCSAVVDDRGVLLWSFCICRMHGLMLVCCVRGVVSER